MRIGGRSGGSADDSGIVVWRKTDGCERVCGSRRDLAVRGGDGVRRAGVESIAVGSSENVADGVREKKKLQTLEEREPPLTAKGAAPSKLVAEACIESPPPFLRQRKQEAGPAGLGRS